MEYTRSPNCECSKYKNITDVPAAERGETKTYWMKGYIYEDGKTRECKCHQDYRMLLRYNSFAELNTLPGVDELKTLPYVEGESKLNPYKMLTSAVDKAYRLKGVVFYVCGKENCQKTTSMAKIALHNFLSKKIVNYYLFNDLMSVLSSEDADNMIKELKAVDLLIVEDCFEREEVVLKNRYNAFFNIILGRKNPTILTTPYSFEELKNGAGSYSSSNKDAINKLEITVGRLNSAIQFNDDISLNKAGFTSTLNLWS